MYLVHTGTQCIYLGQHHESTVVWPFFSSNRSREWLSKSVQIWFGKFGPLVEFCRGHGRVPVLHHCGANILLVLRGRGRMIRFLVIIPILNSFSDAIQFVLRDINIVLRPAVRILHDCGTTGHDVNFVASSFGFNWNTGEASRSSSLDCDRTT